MLFVLDFYDLTYQLMEQEHPFLLC